MTKKKPQLPPAKPPVSTTTVWLAVIASTLVAILVYVGLSWLDNQASTATASEVHYDQTEIGSEELLIIGLIAGAVVLGPGILVALIVLPIIHKNKKK